jgi:hypothetical protein
MVYLQFGQDRLAQPHPLKAFELSQRTIKVVLAPSRQKCRPLVTIGLLKPMQFSGIAKLQSSYPGDKRMLHFCRCGSGKLVPASTQG